MNPDVAYELSEPTDPDAVASVQAYFDEIDERFPDGFTSTSIEADEDRYRSPHGAFVVARLGGRTVGCGGVTTFEPGVGEIKRMWVDHDVRGQGVASGLLAELEEQSRLLGHDLVRLDTHELLPEAIRLYEAKGYRRIERYNDNPYPTHFYEKVFAAEAE